MDCSCAGPFGLIVLTGGGTWPAPTARTDDVLAGVAVPVSGAVSPAAGQLSHLKSIREELVSRRLSAGAHDIPPGGVVQ